MRKWIVVVGAIGLIVLAVGVAVAQDGVLAGLMQPTVVTIEQAVPVNITLALPQEDGSVITTTAPLTVGISLQVKIDGQNVVAVTTTGEASDASAAVATEAPKAKKIWDIPHMAGVAPEPIDIGGFKMQPVISLFDFDQVKNWDVGNAAFYDRSEFQGASILGVLQVTMTNTTEEDLHLSTLDGAIVVGSEQADLSDFQFYENNSINEKILPGVVRHAVMIFGFTNTKLADIADGEDVRVQLSGPIKEDGFRLVKDSKYKATVTLVPTP